MKPEMFSETPQDKQEVILHYGGCTIQSAFVHLLEKIAQLLATRTYSHTELYELLIYDRVLKPGYFKEFLRLMRFGVREGIIKKERLGSLKRRSRKLPNFFTRDQLVRYFWACNNVWIAFASFLSFWCSFRTSEVIRLKPTDFDFENSVIRVVDSKGGKDRYVPFIPKIHGVVRKWLRYIGNSEYLFPSYESHSFATANEHHISDRTLTNGFNEALQAAGLDTFDGRYANGRKKGKLTFYALRHSFATHNIERKVPAPFVQKAMGHDKIDTTIKNYTHIRDPVMVEAIASAFEKPKPTFTSAQLQVSSPVALLAQKFALGEISDEEFAKRRRVLAEAGLL